MRQTAKPIAIEWRGAASLTFDERNPRIHDQKQINRVAQSLREFGIVLPIVVDAKGKIISGHCVMMAAIKIGVTQVPVVLLEHLSEAQARALSLALNRLPEHARWDAVLLGDIFKNELRIDNISFDPQVTGFNTAEIDLFIEGTKPTPDDTDRADQVPEPQSAVATSRHGDFWTLGDHKVLCADALGTASYAQLLGEDRARIVFTDPPYNVRIDGHASGLGRTRHRSFPMANGEKSPAEFIEFLTTAFRHFVSYSVDGAIHFVCMDWRHLRELLAAGATAYSELKNICVWTKNNAGMGSFYRSQHEMVAVFKAGTAAHLNNIELGRHGRNRTNVWSYPSASTFSRSSDEGYLLGLHPTVKPVRMVADALLDCSRRGDIVLDAFLGSGTTVMAAERTGRRAYGLELDPLYVDTIIRRWQNYTGEDARHAVTGKTFAEHERGACHESK